MISTRRINLSWKSREGIASPVRRQESKHRLQLMFTLSIKCTFKWLTASIDIFSHLKLLQKVDTSKGCYIPRLYLFICQHLHAAYCNNARCLFAFAFPYYKEHFAESCIFLSAKYCLRWAIDQTFPAQLPPSSPSRHTQEFLSHSYTFLKRRAERSIGS